MPTRTNHRTKQAVVIGSGFGGLAIAIRLQAMGFKTRLVEKRDKPGGRAYVYEDQGFTFDAGPTVITAPECLTELFALAGKNMEDYVELLPVMPFYRLLWEDGKVLDYSNDEASLNRQLAEFNPADVAGYAKFCAYADKVFAAGYEKLCHVAFLKIWDMVRVSPQLGKAASLPFGLFNGKLIHQGRSSTPGVFFQQPFDWRQSVPRFQYLHIDSPFGEEVGRFFS